MSEVPNPKAIPRLRWQAGEILPRRQMLSLEVLSPFAEWHLSLLYYQMGTNKRYSICSFHGYLNQGVTYKKKMCLVIHIYTQVCTYMTKKKARCFSLSFTKASWFDCVDKAAWSHHLYLMSLEIILRILLRYVWRESSTFVCLNHIHECVCTPMHILSHR